MRHRLEKIIPDKRQRRFYTLSVVKTLFDEWCLIREWGRIGSKGGQRMVDYFMSEAEAIIALNALWQVKIKRGYTPEVG